MSRDVVLGASGLIGSYLLRSLETQGRPAVGTYLSHPSEGLVQLDLADDAAVDTLLETEQPNCIYVAAANPNVEWIEENAEAAYAQNVAPMEALVEKLSRTSVRLLYFSTDYVFDGAEGAYAEDVEPRPLNVYGEHKLQVERLIQENLSRFIIARVTGVFGWEKVGKNFVQRMVRNFQAGQTSLRVPVDQIGSPSYAPNVADACVRLMQSAPTGIYHVAGDALANRYEFACEIAQVFDLPSDGIVPMTTAELKQKANRPLRAGLIVDKAQSFLDFPLLGYRLALRDMKESESHYAQP
jgi:dTDP-4-dehydrorhamnose reductase